MVRTTGNQKISIMLVLSITILAAVLVTGTVVNIVSAANSINVQTKTNLVTSTRSPHMVSSATHGNVNVQPKTSQHPVTSKGSPHILPSAAHGTKCYSGPCPNGTWGSKFTRLVYIPPSKDQPLLYGYSGTLVGETFSGVWYGIKSAPIKIGIAYRDGHCCLPYPDSGTDKWMGLRDETSWNGHPGEPGDGTFHGNFVACDNPNAKDHTAYFTAYFDGGGVNIDTSPGAHGRAYAYDYDHTDSFHDLGSNSRLLNIDICHYGQAHFTAHK
jgi:hypothetical protein